MPSGLPQLPRIASARCTARSLASKLTARKALLLATVALGTVASSAYGVVFCGTQNPETQEFEGALVGREQSCEPGEAEVGHVVNAEQDVVELFGNQIDLPDGTLLPEESLHQVDTEVETEGE